MRKDLLSRFVLLGGALIVTAVVAVGAGLANSSHTTLQFVITSDAHYGLTRATFRGQHDVDAHLVNAALVAQINALAEARFPGDQGLNAGKAVGPMDFVVETGDIANREEQTGEVSIQPASVSWAQFVSDYADGLRVLAPAGRRAPLFLVPGNHEASNAVGFYRSMRPPTDETPLVGIYNAMMKPTPPKTDATFDYDRDRVFYTKDFSGVHFVFLHVWPDSAMRARLSQDLTDVDPATPVVLFAHDQPDVEGKHFINPNGAHDINATDLFENLLADRFEDGPNIDTPSLIEQQQFEDFLGQHPNITAYFHGNSNWHQVYDWNGPGRSARLHTVRVDSPMKGAVSSLDETRLSFAVVTIDPEGYTMTVRERLWNANPSHPQDPAAWGETVTTTLDFKRAALGASVASR